MASCGVTSRLLLSSTRVLALLTQLLELVADVQGGGAVAPPS